MLASYQFYSIKTNSIRIEEIKSYTIKNLLSDKNVTIPATGDFVINHKEIEIFFLDCKVKHAYLIEACYAKDSCFVIATNLKEEHAKNLLMFFVNKDFNLVSSNEKTLQIENNVLA